MTLFHAYIESPLGKLKIVYHEQALIALLWPNDDPKRVALGSCIEKSHHPLNRTTKIQLMEYFNKKRSVFDLPLELRGTSFQKEVWKALLDLSYGETSSYLDLAKSIGRPKAFRAVGTAIGKNPLSIIIPCHRVIGSNGSLTRFAGGLESKAFLISLEKDIFSLKQDLMPSP